MKINGKNIEDFLNGKQIIKVYYGKDNWCRCGCGGYYFEPGHTDFDNILQLAFQRCNGMRPSSKLVKKNFYVGEPSGKLNEGYINIPMEGNRCYCVYYR